ncbi:MAG: maleylpyruvate isomerase family mycothiol-dependent enzyme, partial [Actinomycetota bacterium]
MAEPDDRPGAHTDRTDAGERYRRCREAYSDLIRSLRDDELRATLPTCPGWSVHDVTAHLAGVAADVVNGVSPGADPEAWTATQVAVRRDTATSVVLREWERSASQLEVLLAKGDQRYPAYTLDVLCHEQDVRGAVGRPGRRDGPDLLAVADALGGRLQQLVESAALAQVAVIHDGEVWSGDPA